MVTNEPKGPYSIEECRGIAARCWCDKRTETTEMHVELAEVIAEAIQKAWLAGRASRDGLRDALFEVTGWASDCYCLSEEEASSPGGKTCPGCVAKEALAEDEKEGK